MNDKRQFLVASVLAIQDSCFLYPSCQNCCTRLIQTSRSFDCLRCGCRSEAEQVNYRYKLSVRVADKGELFIITVFGSCLDAYFGVSAGALQRYIQDLIQVSEQECSTIQDLLFQAAEYCFVGRTFVFGLKTSVNHGGQSLMSNSTLQSSYTSNRYIKYLVACQISLPNLGYVGCTVISCFKRLLESVNFNHVSGASQPPGSVLIEIDLPSGELSSLCGSGSTQESVLSSSRDDLSSPWQQISFELISLSVEKASKELSPSETACTRDNHSQTWEQEHISEKPDTLGAGSQPTQDESRSEEKEEEGETSCEFGVKPSVSNFARSKASQKLKNTSQLALAQPLDTHDFRPVKSTLGVEDKYSETEIACTPTCLDESWNPVLCMHHSNLLCSPELLCKKSRAAGICEDNDPAIWDDLPLSESLSEFIARVETNKSPVSPQGFDASHSPASETIDELENADSLHPNAKHPCFNSSPESATRKSAQVAQIVNSCTGYSFGLESTKRRATEDRKLLNRRLMQAEEDWNCSRVPLPLYATVPSAITNDLWNSLSPSIYLSKSGSLPITSRSKSSKSGTVIALALKHSANPCVQRTIKPAQLSSEKIKRQKLDFSYPNVATSFYTNEDICKELANQDVAQINSQNLNFDLQMQQKDKSLGKYESDVKTDVQAVTCEWLLQNNIQSSDNGFDASAELFDSTGKELEIVAETQRSQVAFQEPPVTKNHASPERVLSGLNGEFNNSQDQVFLLTPNNSSPSKHSSPVIYSQYDAGHDEDFVPFSQSTPVARKFPKGVSLKVNEPMAKKLTHKCRRSSTLLTNNLLKQLTGHCLAISQKQAGPLKQLHFTISSSNDLFESDSEEWIPPSATKLIQSFILSKSTVPCPDTRGQREKYDTCKMADEGVSENKENSRKQRSDAYFIRNDLKATMMQFAPTLIQNTSINTKSDKNPDARAWLLETEVDARSSSEVTKCNSTSADRLFYSETDTNNVPGEWSPELFAEKSVVFQGRDFIQKQLF